MRWIFAGVLLGAVGCVAGAGKPIPLNPVRFLLVNDVYVADTMADGNGGLARVATVRQRLADQGPVLFVLAGDVLSPSLLSKYYNGRQMVEAFNAAKLDYATFGNHEFELPLDTLETRIAESHFKWISSNCSRADGTPFAKVLPWDTLHVSGHKVGLFGLTLIGNYRKAYRCTDPDSAAHLAIDTLVALGADLVVGITHQGRSGPALTRAAARPHPRRPRARVARFGGVWPPRGQGRRQLAHGPVRHPVGRQRRVAPGRGPGEDGQPTPR
jgi:2',3'-cyclic-nucleotide 2'-phosphodiesterase (5'-nucleotidase family)